MSDTNMGDVDSVSQDGQQPDDNNWDQVQPDEDQMSDFVSQADQLDQGTMDYLENLKNRQTHDHDWWGTRHKYPEIGDPDREFIFARNPPISDEEFRDAVAAFDNVATNEGTVPYDTLGVSMRPTTPPMERAKKQVEGLVEQGIEVTEALSKEIYEKYTRDSGLIAALQEYCRNGDGVPNAHANELLKMLDRLKVVCAEEMAKLNEQLKSLSDNFDDYRKSTDERAEVLRVRRDEAESKLAEANDKLHSTQSELDNIQQQRGMDPNDQSTKQINELKEENSELSKKLKSLEEEIAQGKADRDQIQNDFGEKANGLSQSEEKAARLLREKAALQSKIVMYEAGKTREQVQSSTEDVFDMFEEHQADLAAAEERVKVAESEREQGNLFHQNFYKIMKERVSSWEDKATAADQSSKEYGSSVSSDTVKALEEVAQDLDEMVLEFQRNWPPARGAFDGGQIQDDNVTKDALERSNRELKEKYEENQREIRKMEETETEMMEKIEELNQKINDKKETAKVYQNLVKDLEELVERKEKLKAENSSSSSDSDSSKGDGNKKSSSPASSPPEDIRKLKEELSQYMDFVAENEDEIDDLKKKNEKLADEVEQLKGRKVELEKQHQENQEKIKKLETQRRNLMDESTGLMKERSELRADIKKVRGEKEELVKQKKQLESKLTTNQDELKKLQKEKEKLEKLGKLRKDDYERLKERMEAEEKKTGNLRVDAGQLLDLRKDKAQLESQHATDQDDLEKARAENRGLTKERDELKQENKKLQVDYKEQKRQLERYNENLKKYHDANGKDLETLHRQGDANYQSADALIRAAGRLRQYGGNNIHTPPGGPSEMSLMDKINYLNLSVFLRTRNYVELALREGCNRLANMLIHDANKWAEQCREDLSKMNPSVNIQVRASIYVLNGLKRVMVAKDMDEINKGAREFKYGQKRLVSQNADPATFGQLIDLAGSLVDWLDRLRIEHDSPERRRGLQADKLSWRKNMEFVVGRRAKKLRDGVRGDPNLKSDVLRRTGLHSPLTPEKWDVNIDLEESLIDDDEVVA